VLSCTCYIVKNSFLFHSHNPSSLCHGHHIFFDNPTHCYDFLLLLYLEDPWIRLPNLQRNASEEKLSKTLLFLTGTFVVTCFPFEVLVVVLNLCVSCRQIPLASVYVIRLLHYSNSLINIIIYPLRIPEFKKALLHLFPSFGCLRQRHRGRYRIHGGISVISMTTAIDSFSLLGFEATEQTSYL